MIGRARGDRRGEQLVGPARPGGCHTWKATGDERRTGRPLELAGNAVEVVRRQADGTWSFVIDDPYGGAPDAA
jgi:hypothetical protein